MNNKYLFHGKLFEHKTSLNEVTRWEILRRSQSESPDRYEKKRNYSPKDFKNVDFEDLFTNNTFTWSTRVHGASNYIVTISFEGPFDLLKYDLKSMKGKNRWKRITLPMVTKALSTALDTEDLYIDCSCPDFCLTADTNIRLFNGDVVTVENLYNQFNEGKYDLFVFSTDVKGDFKKGKVTDVWISGQTNELIKVTLSNGNTLTTTPNHGYMLIDGSYLSAENLTINQELMPLYFTKSGDNVEWIKLNSTSNTFGKITDSSITKTNICNYHIYVKNIERIELKNPVNVYDLTVDEYNNFYVEAGVILHNCYRFKYWATQADCNYGVPQNRAPRVRNVRNNKGYCCKHILAILYGKRWVQSAAKAWLQYMRANPELTEFYIWDKKLKDEDDEGN